MKNVLITGGSGFFGSLLKERLLNEGYSCVNVDLVEDNDKNPNLISIKGDIRNIDELDALFNKYRFDIIFHFAAILAHAAKDKDFLWTCNVNGTKNIVDLAKKYDVPKIIFTSSNCLWGEGFGRPVKEDDIPNPIEIYGRSKWDGEKILLDAKNDINIIIFRCPTIIDCGRLGLLAILFEFIDEGRKVWVLDGGKNKYQFIYAQDLIDACMKSLDHDSSDIFNIGSDDVKSFREIYSYVIDKANTNSKIASIPKNLAVTLMKVAYILNISPLGPYQYKMLGEDFIFDTTKIKKSLNWKPTLTNEEMLLKAYKYYHENLADIRNRHDVSAHRQAARMGVIKLLKYIS